MSIPDFCLACGRQTLPTPERDALPLADRYARDLARETDQLTLPVLLGAAWWVAVAVVLAAGLGAIVWAVAP